MESFGVESLGDANKRTQTQAWERRKLGLDLRQKYEMYFVAVAFTLAGLAVQSAKPAAYISIAVIEISGWVFLSSAGLLGLWRISKLWLVQVGVAEHEAAAYGFAPPPPEHLNKIEYRVRYWARAQFMLFGIGLALLMLSRAAVLIS